MNIKECFTKIAYGKVDKAFYKENIKLLECMNYQSIKSAYLNCSILCTVLFITSLVWDIMNHLKVFYLCYTTYYLIGTVMVHIFLKKNQRYNKLFYYGLMVVVFSMVGILGIYNNKGRQAVMFFVCLMILPALYIEKPIHTFIFTAIMSSLFIIATIRIKAQFPLVIMYDVFNTSCCFVISCAWVWSIRNMIFENIKVQLYFEKKSQIDQLTGLFNKGHTESLCKAYLMGDQRVVNSALIVIDVDNFKNINDTKGHTQGDCMLRGFGLSLKEIFKEDHIIGRIGGDEFLVLIKNVQDKKEVEQKAREVLSKVECTCSIGVAMVNSQSRVYQDLFEKADEALYEVKRSGKGTYRFYKEG